MLACGACGTAACGKVLSMSVPVPMAAEQAGLSAGADAGNGSNGGSGDGEA